MTNARTLGVAALLAAVTVVGGFPLPVRGVERRVARTTGQSGSTGQRRGTTRMPSGVLGRAPAGIDGTRIGTRPRPAAARIPETPGGAPGVRSRPALQQRGPASPQRSTRQDRARQRHTIEATTRELADRALPPHIRAKRLFFSLAGKAAFVAGSFEAFKYVGAFLNGIARELGGYLPTTIKGAGGEPLSNGVVGFLYRAADSVPGPFHDTATSFVDSAVGAANALLAYSNGAEVSVPIGHVLQDAALAGWKYALASGALFVGANVFRHHKVSTGKRIDKAEIAATQIAMKQQLDDEAFPDVGP